MSADAARAVAEFRGRRLGEPLKRYLDAFDASKQGNAELIARLNEVLSVDGAGSDFLKSLWRTESGVPLFVTSARRRFRKMTWKHLPRPSSVPRHRRA